MVPMGELTGSESMSTGASDIALEISHALGESLSEIQAQYFRGSDTGNVDWDLAEERDCLQEDLQAREDWDEAHMQERRQEILSHYEDNMF
jgi:hypothetical protein